jgi:hypothetical protein
VAGKAGEGRREADSDALTKKSARKTAKTGEKLSMAWAVSLPLRNLGERENSTENLNEAIAAFQSALSGYEESQAPYYETMAKRNLAQAQTLLVRMQGKP